MGKPEHEWAHVSPDQKDGLLQARAIRIAELLQENDALREKIKELESRLARHLEKD